ncbi:tRNA (adenosine(37)-N6)-threonylcarbamoyltransferase complex dimerization subunit type 1 TsaB [Luteimonas yindakuii]|uniref:tRNA (adenosine(37)-N6)-threonylcarbamoyltransferase complex dimerization subunit type 1 TsaB n=1 Tax=Luteimonas yindakuii TaxID=2565782 RepID=UPI0010A4866D|nr:tRNA (adenosine(37)-N6)-threonylcarbamoyltransferase complex dimerization subunit type 1 TsaB [Luteimonas yindakuii]QCO68308.1 tRNA (adenosine(37)-N6)-threonylcarbamoyltransferase complex dimerization subunit type 1 TsaB [Luteimonas yindakuii]
MYLLAFETATEACSVAVFANGEVRERFELAPRRHAELALPWAEALLAEAGIARSRLDAIAVGRGPGAFTGVRLGIALAQGVALALDVPVVAVSTLATLAAPVLRDTPQARVLAAIDARMGEVYAAAFAAGEHGPALLDAERVCAPDQVDIADAAGWIGVGTGFDAVDGALAQRLAGRLQRVDATALPHAADTARVAVLLHAAGAAVAPERVEPAYLRNNVALTLAEQAARRG